MVLPGSGVRAGGRGLLPHRADGGRRSAAAGGGTAGPHARGHAPRGACADRLSSACRAARRWPWIAIAASVAVHSLLLFGWVDGRHADVPHRPPAADRARPAGRRADRVPMPYRVPAAPRATRAAGTRRACRRVASGPRPVPRPEAVAVLPEPEPQPVPARHRQRPRGAAPGRRSGASGPAWRTGGSGSARCRSRRRSWPSG